MVERPLLVTGATGFVGSAMRPKVVEAFAGSKVIFVARSRRFAPSDQQVDLADEDATRKLLARTRPKCIIHLAAHSSVGAAYQSPSGVWRDNRDASFSLARAIAATVPDATVLMSSTSEVYGDAFRDGPVDESTAPRPRGPYAVSKLASEQVFQALLPDTARLIICRPVNHTGPGQREDFVIPSFAAQVTRIALGHAPPKIEVGNIDAWRDFLDVEDVVDAYIALLKRADTLPNRLVLNVASGEQLQVRGILEFFTSRVRRPIEIVVDESRLRPNDIARVDARCDRLRRLVDWAPKRNLQATLLDVLADKQHCLSRAAG